MVIAALADDHTEYPEDAERLEVRPHSLACTVDVVDSDSNFLIGLDMQRLMKIELNAIENKVWKHEKGNTGVKHLILMVQAAGTGLLCIRVDN